MGRFLISIARRGSGESPCHCVHVKSIFDMSSTAWEFKWLLIEIITMTQQLFLISIVKRLVLYANNDICINTIILNIINSMGVQVEGERLVSTLLINNAVEVGSKIKSIPLEYS